MIIIIIIVIIVINYNNHHYYKIYKELCVDDYTGCRRQTCTIGAGVTTKRSLICNRLYVCFSVCAGYISLFLSFSLSRSICLSMSVCACVYVYM